MGYLTNSGSGFMKDAVTTVSNVKSYLINKTGYLVDAIRVGIGDFGQRVLNDGGTVEASAEAAASYREITKDIYDQASLVLFPSGYKDNLLYSHKPVDGSGDFTYTRGTDTATRVGADGYIKKERANLLVQSNQFDTTWSTSSQMNTSVGGQSGYDGSSDAWKIQRSDANARFIKQITSQSGVQTFSVYAKKGNVDYISLVSVGSQTTKAIFSLPTDGSGTNTYLDSDNIFADIVHIANGWYRVSTTIDESITDVRIYPSETATAEGGVITDAFIYIQDSQIEEGLVATPYIETTTAPVYEGLTDNLPRIDYTGGTPSILLEPSRQNRLPNSEYFGDWINTSASFAYNVSNSPEGVKNAIRIIPNSSDFQIKAPVNTTTGTLAIPIENTFSVFLKYETGGFEYAVLGSGAPQQRYAFNIAEGTKVGSIGSTDVDDEKASIESYGNGWYRCAVTTSNTAGNKHSIYLSDDGTSISATGSDGTKGMLAWGAQAERESSYPTSYIPTYVSSATRAADDTTLNNLQSNNIAGDTFSYFFEWGDYVAERNFEIRDSSNNLTLFMVSRLFRYYQDDGSVDTLLTLPTSGTSLKCMVTYDGTTLKGFVNGTPDGSVTDADADKFSDINKIRLDRDFPDKEELRSLMIFPTALSDDDCEALTAL